MGITKKVHDFGNPVNKVNYMWDAIFDNINQMVNAKQWWENTEVQTINGGFFKYYPKDCKYIFDKFMKDIDHWQSYYIEKGVTIGPVNGDQNFVEESVKEKLDYNEHIYYKNTTSIKIKESLEQLFLEVLQ